MGVKIGLSPLRQEEYLITECLKTNYRGEYLYLRRGSKKRINNLVCDWQDA
jgi:hypothetical protein